MTHVPTFNASDKKYILTSYEQFSIPAKAKNPELAKEFLKYLYTDDSVKLFAEKANGVYALTGAQNLVKNILLSNGSTFVYDSFSALDGATSMMMNWKALPKGSKINISDEIFTKCVTPVMNGSMTTDQWADQVESAFAQARSEIAAAK
jgi:N-acetylglucosamine transport system substrate-binding protein